MKDKPIRISEGTRMPMSFQVIILLLLGFSIFNLSLNVFAIISVFLLKTYINEPYGLFIWLSWNIFFLIVVIYLWKGYKWARFTFIAVGILDIISTILYYSSGSGYSIFGFFSDIFITGLFVLYVIFDENVKIYCRK